MPNVATPSGSYALFRRLRGPKWIFNVRGLLMVPPVLFMFICFRWETEVDAVILPLGAIIFASGMALRVWAQMHLHYRLRVRKTLTTTGPYSMVRNPIYIANTLIMAGICVMSELLWFLPITVMWCAVVYSLVVRYEEHHLSEKYGVPYAEYRASVPRWFPRLHRNASYKAVKVRQWLFSSVAAELHCLFLPAFILVKELID